MTPMADREGPWLGLDVGGANIKASHEFGPSLSVPFPLWRDPTRLPTKLGEVIRRVPSFSRVALTMTAELCDCFRTKAEGVRSVVEAVLSASGPRKVCVWGVDSRFHDVRSILIRPDLAGASNWLALAEVAASLIAGATGLLIDVGSTTTDIIPLAEGRPSPRGRSDTERLGTGELIYAGVRRTPLCALATELPYRGVPTGLAAELFATTLDIYIALGAIPPSTTDIHTADGRPATTEASRDRLARMVGADRSVFTHDDALVLSRAADRLLVARLVEAARRATVSTIGRPSAAILSGSGEFLARRVAQILCPDAPILSLGHLWGIENSTAACAYALVLLARKRAGLRDRFEE